MSDRDLVKLARLVAAQQTQIDGLMRTQQVARTVVGGVPVEDQLAQAADSADRVAAQGDDIARLDDGTGLAAWDAAQRVPVADDYIDDLAQRQDEANGALSGLDEWRDDRYDVDEAAAVEGDGLRADVEQAGREVEAAQAEAAQAAADALDAAAASAAASAAAAAAQATAAAAQGDATQAIADAESKSAAAQAAAEAYAEAEAEAARLAAIAAAEGDATQKAADAQAAAEAAAAADATAKANAAEAAAKAAASGDATDKANAAQAAAEAAAAADAATKAEAARVAAEAAAASDATAKADAARAAAELAAAADAKAKADAAEAAAKADAAAAQATADAATSAAGAAQDAADSVRFLAEGLYQAIPSVEPPTASPSGELKQGDLWFRIGADGTPIAGKLVGIQVWDGTQWQPRELLSDSVLVVGEDGVIRLKDGIVDAKAVNADVFNGRTFFGGEFVGGRFYLPGRTTVMFETPAASTKEIADQYWIETFYGGSGSAWESPENAIGQSYDSSTHFIGNLPAAPLGAVYTFTGLVKSNYTGLLRSYAKTPDGNILRSQPVSYTPGAVEWLPFEATVETAAGASELGFYFEPWGSLVRDLKVKMVRIDSRALSIESRPSGSGVFVAGAKEETVISENEVTAGSPFTAPGNVFALKSQLNAWSPIDGTRAWVTSEGREYVRAGGKWKVGVDVIANTDWLMCTRAAGVAAQGSEEAFARIRDGRIEFKWGVNGSGFAVGTEKHALTLPASIVPDAYRYGVIAGSGGRIARAVVRPDRIVSIQPLFDTSTYFILDSLSVPV